ncbi:MAG: hypothetical protein K2Z25_22520 [Beijerinckiaceae bacterium]|nr:hypothetical protein [Beijerinckiaceae bacterium]
MSRENRLDPSTPLVAYPWVVVRLRCHVCPRNADVRLAALASRYGHRAPLRLALHGFMALCPWDPHSAWRSKPQKYGHRCGAYLPDLNSTAPPDLPPAMGGLSLIEGGKDDMLPAEPAPLRRRVGGEGVTGK